jgi:hypothetical protein
VQFSGLGAAFAVTTRELREFSSTVSSPQQHADDIASHSMQKDVGNIKLVTAFSANLAGVKSKEQKSTLVEGSRPCPRPQSNADCLYG